MRIALVSEHASPLAALGGVDAGGQNVHVAALADRLVALGHQVVVSTRRDGPLPDVVVAGRGVVVRHLDAGPARYVPKDELFPHMDAFARQLAAAWAIDRPDVVHAHFWMSGHAAQQAAAALDIPVVQTFHALGTVKRRHQGVADTSPPERIGVEQRLARTCDAIVATCRDEVAELCAMGARRSVVRVVPCGFRPEVFHPDGVRRAGSGRPTVVAVSRLVPRKGLADVITALTRLPDAEFVVVGGPATGDLDDDEEFRRLDGLARRSAVRDRVTFLGGLPPETVADLMRRAAVVVCAPWYEPFGIVPVEAMACGTPVVGTAVGGLLDTVIPGVTGLLVPPREPDALAAALRSLLADDAARSRMGRAAARWAASRFTWERVAAETEQVYRAVHRARVASRHEARAS